MADNVTIFRVDTGEAVQSVNDLRENIKTLKAQLGDLQIGSDEYQDTLKELKVNQAALKDAMYGTAASLEDVQAAAKGANVTFDEQNKLVEDNTVSYNALVRTMADLKQEWRATSDAARRAELGEQIDQVNTKLKELDASVGNYSRNVGNYESALNNLHTIVGSLPKPLSDLKAPLDAVDKSMKLMSVNPVFGIISLLSPVLEKIAASLGENETALAGVEKIMKGLEPVMAAFNVIVQKLAEYFSSLVDYVVEFAKDSGASFDTVVSGATGVGNAVLQFVLTPIRSVIAAVKGLGESIKNVFKGDFAAAAQSAKDALTGIGDAFAKGFDFANNFAVGKQAGEEFAKGLTSNKPKVKEAAEETVADYLKFLDQAASDIDKLKFDVDIDFGDKDFDKKIKQRLARLDVYYKQKQEWNKLARDDSKTTAENEEMRAAESYKIQKEYDEKKLELLKQFAADALAAGNLDAALEYEQQAADLSVEIAQKALAEEQRLQDEAEKRRLNNLAQSVKIMQQSATLVNNILGEIASAYQESEEDAEKNAEKIKALQIAQATINTIAGVVGAFMGITKDTGGWGIALATVQAATVAATGIAQIAKMQNTKVGSGNSSSGSSSLSSISAPSVSPSIPEVRTVTSASEEDRLNQMAQDQRVYIVAGDIAESQNRIRVQTRESSF